jgi:SAM-dependent methyltransferase
MQEFSQEDKVRAIFGERASMYATSHSHTDQEVLAWVVRCARPDPGWKALDVATGAGHTAFALAPRVSHVIGIDLTPEMLEEAKRLQAQNKIKNVSFEVADVHRLPFEAGCFDLATSRRAPHHFSNIRKAIKEMRRVLKPGGRLVIDDRSTPEDDEVDQIMNRLDVLHDESHVREYRPSKWRAMLEEAGFQVETIEPFSQLRPISHMKQGVTATRAAEIDRIMSRLTERQKLVLQATQRDGELRHLHFLVMIAAVKR